MGASPVISLCISLPHISYLNPSLSQIFFSLSSLSSHSLSLSLSFSFNFSQLSHRDDSLVFRSIAYSFSRFLFVHRLLLYFSASIFDFSSPSLGFPFLLFCHVVRFSCWFTLILFLHNLNFAIVFYFCTLRTKMTS